MNFYYYYLFLIFIIILLHTKGLLSSNMKIVQAHITIQGTRNKDKKEWKSSVVNNPDELRALQSVHIDNVRIHLYHF